MAACSSQVSDKPAVTCWAALDRLATATGRFLTIQQPATPGFQEQQLEARLQAHHAAMDFSTPAGGRIISDPREAATVCRSPSSRPPPSLPTLAPPPAPPAVEEGCTSAPWFRPQMGRDQANLALFPHRQTPGLFLVRDCSRREGGFVLSFTTHQGRIVHAQILPVLASASPPSTAYSLDGGRTKFCSLSQLVDFHRMNLGPLPCLLTTWASS